MIEKNAVIESVSLSNDDHGLLSAWLNLSFGDGLHQGFGGFTLYLPKDFKHHGGKNYAGHFIFRCLQVAGIGEWSKLPGRTIRVRHDKEGLGASILAIGHIVKDDWFDPSKEFETLPL